MPPSLRRRPQHHQLSPPPPEPFADSDDDIVEEELDPEQDEGDVLGDEGLEMEGEEEDEDDEDDEPLVSPSHPHSIHHDPPPPHLREISTLASWTVSSSKPGCSIPQLRHPSTSLFWQSDGPQPHYLNIHFFKLVRIVGLRLYLDFEQDESYTPTRIIFLAGSGMNDLQEWGEMRLESPKGWVWADFSGVGEAESESDNEDDDEDCEPGDNDATDDERTRPGARDATRSGYESDFENTIPRDQTTGRPPAPEAMQVDPQATPQQQPQTSPTATPQQTTPTLNRPTPRLPFASLSANTPTQTPRSNRRNKRPKMPVLRAHLVQIKILENHQNGKDTHLRGLQIFARDDEKEAALRKAEGGGGVGVGLGIGKGDERNGRRRVGKGRGLGGGFKGIGRSEWDVEPSIR